MERWNGTVAVVTGASSGIGAAVATALVLAGLQVAGIARRKNRLDDLAGQLSHAPGKFYPVQADLTKEEEIIKAFDYIKNNIGPVGILVNNAGTVRLDSDLAHGKTASWDYSFKLNVIGLLISSREAIKSMEESNIAGHIVDISSVLGHRVEYFPNVNVYPATKFAVTALSETLRLELNAGGSKIKVTNLSPGAVKSELLFGGNPTKEQAETVKPFLESHNFLEPEDIAQAVLYVVGTPPHVQIHELTIAPFDPPKRNFTV